MWIFDWFICSINVFIPMILSLIVYKTAKEVCEKKYAIYITFAVISLVIGYSNFNGKNTLNKKRNMIEENICDVENKLKIFSEKYKFDNDELYDVYSSIETLKDSWNDFRYPKPDRYN